MSSSEKSSSEHPEPTSASGPPSLRYPEKSAAADHKMKSGTVVGIVIACIIAAVAATSAVLFAGPEPAPKQMNVDIAPTGKSKASAEIPGTESVHPRLEGGSPSAMVKFASNLSPLPLGPLDPLPQVPPVGDLPLVGHDFPSGLQLELATGWSVVDSSDDDSIVQLGRDGAAVLVLMAVGTAKATDIVEVLTGFVNATSKEVDNLELIDGSGKQSDIEGQNFTQLFRVEYTGSISNNQGTTEVYGIFLQLFNPQNRLSAFVDYRSDDPETLNKYSEELEEMLNSIA